MVKAAGRRVAAPSDDADIFLTSYLDQVDGRRPSALKVRVEDKEDIEAAISAAKRGAEAVIVETGDWKIIPLENLVAEMHSLNTKLYAAVSDVEEIPTMLSILELGVDGVVIATGRIEDVKRALRYLSAAEELKLTSAKVVDVKSVGVGDRACVDTAFLLKPGEGLLVGSQSNILFLVHNESSGSKFTSPRPFRVNAGSVHSYILLSNGRTKYLSELESGDEVLVVDCDGRARVAVVGRVKIERRPLILVKVECDGLSGSVLLQNAETIPLVSRDGKPIPVTELKKGDEVVVKLGGVSGRHFGISVDEFIIEK